MGAWRWLIIALLLVVTGEVRAQNVTDEPPLSISLGVVIVRDGQLVVRIIAENTRNVAHYEFIARSIASGERTLLDAGDGEPPEEALLEMDAQLEIGMLLPGDYELELKLYDGQGVLLGSAVRAFTYVAPDSASANRLSNNEILFIAFLVVVLFIVLAALLFLLRRIRRRAQQESSPGLTINKTISVEGDMPPPAISNVVQVIPPTSATAASTPEIETTADAAPVVFISYRRRSSAMLASLIMVQLERSGVRVFVDTRSVDGAGPFPERLLGAIELADVFICVLGEGTLESEWVRTEIGHAHHLGKPMIPVFQESYVPQTVVEDAGLKALLQSDGVHVLDIRNLYIDEAILRLLTMIRATRSG